MTTQTLEARGLWSRLGAVLTAALLTFALVLGTAPAHADTRTVTANSAGTKDVGAEANVWGNVSGFGGATVTVTSQVLVNGSWSNSRSVTTDGAYVLPLTYGAGTVGSTTWRIRATAGSESAYSSEFTFERTAKPTVDLSTAGSRAVGVGTNAWGNVSGFSGNVNVSLQVLVNGSWSTSRSTTTTGYYALPLTYGANAVGTYSFRVVATDGSVTATSPTVTFRRTANPTVTATSAGIKAVGAGTSVWGKVSGFSKPVTVSTQVLINGRWNTSQRTTTTGSYTLPLTYGVNSMGTTTWRVVASDGSTTATSANFTLLRTSSVKVDARCLTGRALCISKKERKLRWIVNGEVRMTLDVRFGSELTPTRNGAFSVGWKSRNHVSSLYHTPMPYAMFFSGGQAVHFSSDFARRGYNGASHGCVNVRDKAGIAKLFDLVKPGDKVIVYSG